jgi:hypothetical protein
MAALAHSERPSTLPATGVTSARLGIVLQARMAPLSVSRASAVMFVVPRSVATTMGMSFSSFNHCARAAVY